MRCLRPNTDQEIMLRVFANNVPCPEFTPSLVDTEDPNVVECFVPVTEGDEITVRGTITGSCLHGSFDIIADGAFVADRRIEGPKSGNVRHYNNRKVDVRSVFDAPKQPGHSSLYLPDTIVDGYLRVKALTDHSAAPGSQPPIGDIGVGSIVVLVSLNQRADENYTARYRSLTCGDADISRGSICDGGIFPEYELEVRPMEGEVTNVKQSKHKRHAEQTRFGDKPWAKMVFYYRSLDAIKEANCAEADLEASHALEPGNARTFLRGAIRAPDSSQATRSKKRADDEDSTEHDSLFNSPEPSRTDNTAPSDQVTAAGAVSRTQSELLRHGKRRAVSPPVLTPFMPKKKLMGQSLILPPDLAASQTRPDKPPPADPFAALLEEHERKQRAMEAQDQDEEIDDLFGGFDNSLDDAGITQMDGSAEGFELQDIDEGELADALVHAGIELDDVFPDTQVAPVAQMMAYAPADESHGDAETQAEDGLWRKERSAHVKGAKQTPPAFLASEHARTPSPSPQHLQELPTSARTDTASAANMGTQRSQQRMDRTPDRRLSQHHSQSKKEPRVLKVTAADIRARIPVEGITILDLKNSFDEDHLPIGEEFVIRFVALVKKNARLEGGMFYPKSGQATSSPQSQASTIDADGASRTLQSRLMDAATEEHHTQESIEKDPAKATTAIELDEIKSEPEDETNAPRAMPHLRNDTPAPATPSSLPAKTAKKRTSSAVMSSRDSTPANKKPRFDALAARRAEVMRKLQENELRKAAATAAVQEHRAKREQEEALREEAEEREIAAMERRMAEDAEETEALEELAKAEEELLREAREERERVEEAVRASEGA